MKPLALFICLAGIWLSSTVWAEETIIAERPAVRRAEAEGIAFDYPAKLIFMPEKENGSTKLMFVNGSGLTTITIQIFPSDLAPEKLLQMNRDSWRQACKENEETFTENPIQFKIVGQVCEGFEMLYSSSGVDVHQRLFTLKVNDRTLLITTISIISDDEVSQNFLMVFGTSLH